MSREYADGKIKEALRMHDGNLALARQQVIGWARNDTALLYALARPHLDGIVSYQVERVASGRAEIETRYPEEAKSLDQDDDFGMNLLRAVVSTDVPVFGHEQSASPVKRKAASKQHIEAIQKMASNRIVNRKDTDR